MQFPQAAEKLVAEKLAALRPIERRRRTRLPSGHARPHDAEPGQGQKVCQRQRRHDCVSAASRRLRSADLPGHAHSRAPSDNGRPDVHAVTNAYATTMRKAQCATLEMVGVYFDRKRADRGYAYAGASRATRHEDVYHVGRVRRTDRLLAKAGRASKNFLGSTASPPIPRTGPRRRSNVPRGTTIRGAREMTTSKIGMSASPKNVARPHPWPTLPAFLTSRQTSRHILKNAIWWSREIVGTPHTASDTSSAQRRLGISSLYAFAQLQQVSSPMPPSRNGH